MPKKFNPQEYETVKSRKKKFYKDNPDGRIIVEFMSKNPMEYALIKAVLYEGLEDQKNELPKATGLALEVRDTEKKINRFGKEYEAVNYTSWTENCEESAIGRALDNAGYSGDLKCSREEMEQAERNKKAMQTSVVDKLKAECKKSGLAWADCSAWIKKQYARKYEDAAEAMNVNYDEIISYIYGRINDD